MAAFNFPNSPSVNDIHSENGVSFKWNGTVWNRFGPAYTDTANLNVTGIGTIAGNLNVGGVLTYEDVKNVDSVGIVTARAGINLTGGNITLGDSGGSSDDRIKLGASGDLEIFHNGSHSFIKDTGTGNLAICGSIVAIHAADATSNMILCSQSGAVDLFHNNSKKFETSSYGTWLGDNSRVTFGGSAGTPDFHIYHDGTQTNLQNITGDIVIKSTSGGAKAIVVKNAAAVELYHNNIKKFETTSGGAQVTGTLEVTSYISQNDSVWHYWGTGDDCGIMHDGTNMTIRTGTGSIRIEPKSGELGVLCVPDAETALYYNNEKMFDTQGDGCNVYDDDSNVNLYFRTSGGSQRGHIYADTGNHLGFKTTDNEWGMYCQAGAETALYHDGNLKLETTSGGVKVTGGLNYGASSQYQFSDESSEDRFYFKGDGAYGFAFRVNNGNRLEINKTTGDVSMQGASDRNFNWDNSEASLYLTDAGSSSARLKIGTGGDLQMYHDAGSSLNLITCANNQELKVSANKHTFYDYSGVTKRMEIDANGHITSPTHCCFEVKLASSQSFTSGTRFKINFTRVENQQGTSFDTSNNRFTAPVTGYYQFNVGVYSYHSTFMELDGRCNGANTGVKTYRPTTRNSDGHNGNPGASIMASWIVKLTANDYYEIFCLVNSSSGTRNIYADINRTPTWWSGFLVC